MAVAIALLAALLAAAGCGLGPGEGLGDVSLTVTRDYGAEPVLETKSDQVTESDTVMRVLDRDAEISTRYGGGFVQSIEGLEGETGDGGPRDWFFYVNGVESTVGAADYPLHGGEAIWWDYRDWGAAMRVPAVVGSWPQPFTGGYDGRRGPVAVDCRGGGRACGTVRRRLEDTGAPVVAGRPTTGEASVLVGPWSRLREDPAAAQIESGPQASGVFADFSLSGPRAATASNCHLQGLDESGSPATDAGPDAGLVAATRRYDEPPVWVVTGCGAPGVDAAAAALDVEGLRDHYAVLVEGDDRVVPLPRPVGGTR
jgi:hypothetical protein